MSDLLALPRAGQYGCILADPAWRFETYSAKGRGRSPDGRRTNDHGNYVDGANNDPARHYETLSLEEIQALPVRTLAAKDCVLALWAVDSMIPQALTVGAAWGFTFKTVAFYWAKTRRVDSTRGKDLSDQYEKLFPMGTGYWTRANPEPCLLFTRGKPKRVSAGVRKLIVAPRREHSRKPDEQYERIERLVAGPYVELFARQTRSGWDSWGLEVGKFDEVEGQGFSVSSPKRSASLTPPLPESGE
jgi:N6-adenosine-specific RNA methylase IME4